MKILGWTAYAPIMEVPVRSKSSIYLFNTIISYVWHINIVLIETYMIGFQNIKIIGEALSNALPVHHNIIMCHHMISTMTLRFRHACKIFSWNLKAIFNNFNQSQFFWVFTDKAKD